MAQSIWIANPILRCHLVSDDSRFLIGIVARFLVDHFLSQHELFNHMPDDAAEPLTGQDRSSIRPNGLRVPSQSQSQGPRQFLSTM